jgi:hypothetical protein
MLTIIDKAKMFREIVNEMADLYEKKNANYGDSFGQLFDALGPVSGLVPLHNKLDRATSLIKGNKNNFESLEDTFEDMACYAIMNLMETRIRNQKITATGTLTTFPGVVELKPNIITTPKDPCATCPWKDRDFGNLYVGDTPCQWCVYGTKLTCGGASIALDNTDNIKIRATSSTGLEDSIIGSINPTTASSVMKDGTGERVSLETSGMVDECWDMDLDRLYTTNTDDDLTIEEMAEAEREESTIWGNIYAQYLTKRGDK